MIKNSKGKWLILVLMVPLLVWAIYRWPLFYDELMWQGIVEEHCLVETRGPATGNRAVVILDKTIEDVTCELYVFDEKRDGKSPYLVERFSDNGGACGQGILVWSNDGSNLVPYDISPSHDYSGKGRLFTKGYDFKNHVAIIGSYDVYLSSGIGVTTWTLERRIEWPEGQQFR